MNWWISSVSRLGIAKCYDRKCKRGTSGNEEAVHENYVHTCCLFRSAIPWLLSQISKFWQCYCGGDRFKLYQLQLMSCIRQLLFWIGLEANSVVCALSETAYSWLKYASLQTLWLLTSQLSLAPNPITLSLLSINV